MMEVFIKYAMDKVVDLVLELKIALGPSYLG